MKKYEELMKACNKVGGGEWGVGSGELVLLDR